LASSGSREHKIKISVGLTPRVETALKNEARRAGISQGEMARRVFDIWLDNLLAVRESRTKREVLVLDKDTGVLRGAR
jgi:hypothetical protein